ncbi:unnamed protein product [Polarella glacialis]|uniref:Uncharacterized protein n=1 Tax=Polarella glacialis TaxID=89957 RepID=A0A813FCW8_POLGL|nr:unnamed protein product [Polarella glacialis]
MLAVCTACILQYAARMFFVYGLESHSFALLELGCVVFSSLVITFGRWKAEFKEKVQLIREQETLEAKAILESERSMCTSLLNNVCDAYAWLEEDGDTVLEGQSHADKLALEMLKELIPRSELRVEGDSQAAIKLSSLLGADDAARCAQVMSRMQSSDGGAVSLIHVSMQVWDATASRSMETPTDLYLLKWPVPLESGRGRRHFLAGIRQQREQACPYVSERDDGVGDHMAVEDTWQQRQQQQQQQRKQMTHLQEEADTTNVEGAKSEVDECASVTSGRLGSSILFNRISQLEPSLNLNAMMAVGVAEKWNIRAEDRAGCVVFLFWGLFETSHLFAEFWLFFVLFRMETVHLGGFGGFRREAWRGCVWHLGSV